MKKVIDIIINNNLLSIIGAKTNDWGRDVRGKRKNKPDGFG